MEYRAGFFPASWELVVGAGFGGILFQNATVFVGFGPGNICYFVYRGGDLNLFSLGPISIGKPLAFRGKAVHEAEPTDV